MKISGKLAIGFSIVLILAILVGLIGMSGMRNLRESAEFMYENRVRGIEYVHEAQNHFNEMRVESRNVVINSFYDDRKGALDSSARFEVHAEGFISGLQKSRGIADSEELLKFYDRILELAGESYLPAVRALSERSINDIPGHHNKLYINAQLASIGTVATRIENLMAGVLELNSALARQTSIDNTWLTQQYTIFIALLMAAAAIVIIIAAALIIRSVTGPINESAGVLMKIAGGDFEARVKGNYKDEFKIIKSSINYTAQQLADYLEGKMRAERAQAAKVQAEAAADAMKLKNGTAEPDPARFDTLGNKDRRA